MVVDQTRNQPTHRTHNIFFCWIIHIVNQCNADATIDELLTTSPTWSPLFSILPFIWSGPSKHFDRPLMFAVCVCVSVCVYVCVNNFSTQCSTSPFSFLLFNSYITFANCRSTRSVSIRSSTQAHTHIPFRYCCASTTTSI